LCYLFPLKFFSLLADFEDGPAEANDDQTEDGEADDPAADEQPDQRLVALVFEGSAQPARAARGLEQPRVNAKSDAESGCQNEPDELLLL
jgi:hypothetical protein